MKLSKTNFFSLLKETFKEYNSGSVSSDSATIAYYAIFSIPGLLIIVIWICVNVFRLDAIQGQLESMISGAMGSDVGSSVQSMINSAIVDKTSFVMKAIGVCTLIFGSTTLFFNMQKALNNIWDVQAVPKKAFLKFVLDRVNSLGLIVIIAFLLLITSVLSTAIGLANNLITEYFGLEAYTIVQTINFVISFGVVVLLFAIMFKFLPDVKIPWKSIWFGALISALLFSLGKLLLSFYFGKFKPASVFGTAGAVILLMMWVNYSCQIILFGAEFIKVYSRAKGFKVEPSRYAVWQTTKSVEE